MKYIGICRSGGFGREGLTLLGHAQLAHLIYAFPEIDEVWTDRTIAGYPGRPTSEFDPQVSELTIAIGHTVTRRAIRDRLPRDIKYPTIVRPNVVISPPAELGLGTIVCAGRILTCGISIGERIHHHY